MKKHTTLNLYRVHDLIEFKNELSIDKSIYQYGKIVGKEMLGDSDIVKTYKVLVVYDVISYINKKDYCSKTFNLSPNNLPKELELSLLQ